MAAARFNTPEHTIIDRPSIDTTLLFKIWTLDPDGPHADFWFKRTAFFVADYDGDGAMPYTLIRDSLTIYYPDFIQRGRISSLDGHTLKIRWDNTDEATEYTEWKN